MYSDHLNLFQLQEFVCCYLAECVKVDKQVLPPELSLLPPHHCREPRAGDPVEDAGYGPPCELLVAVPTHQGSHIATNQILLLRSDVGRVC